jgi:hypothetical protein
MTELTLLRVSFGPEVPSVKAYQNTMFGELCLKRSGQRHIPA